MEGQKLPMRGNCFKLSSVSSNSIDENGLEVEISGHFFFKFWNVDVKTSLIILTMVFPVC